MTNILGQLISLVFDRWDIWKYGYKIGSYSLLRFNLFFIYNFHVVEENIGYRNYDL